MYELNQRQKNLIVGHKINEIFTAVNINTDYITEKLKISEKKLRLFLDGDCKLPAATAQKVVDMIAAEIRKVFDFAEHPQVHPDINAPTPEEEKKLLEDIKAKNKSVL